MAVTINGTTGITMPAGGLANTAGAAVGTSDTQTLTNKTIQGGALTLATAQATTSGTAIDFTGIPSWVKRVTVMFSGVSTSGTTVRLQLGTSSGVATSGYLTFTGAIAAAAAAGAASTGGFDVTTTAATTLYGAIAFVNQASNSWVGNGALYRNGEAVAAYPVGGITLSGTLDRIRITTVNGTDTFDAGSINLMFEG